jgi:hypothetical protein
MKIYFYLIGLVVLGLFFSCKNDSEEINANLARLNNKSWQLSKIIDSLKNRSENQYNEIFEGNQDEEQMLKLLENKLKTDSAVKIKWIEFQENNLKADSLIKVRAFMLDTINIYVDKYSKFHPEEKIKILNN